MLDGGDVRRRRCWY